MDIIDSLKETFVSMKDNIKKTVVPKDIKYNSKEAYLYATYGVVLSDEDRKTKFIKDCFNLIEYKVGDKKFYCTEELPEDLISYKEEIIEAYKKEGYTCFDLHDYIPKLVSSHVLYFMWAQDFEDKNKRENTNNKQILND